MSGRKLNSGFNDTKRCVFCGIDFIALRKDQIYCTKNCGQRMFHQRHPGRAQEYRTKFESTRSDTYWIEKREYGRKYYYKNAMRIAETQRMRNARNRATILAVKQVLGE